MFSECYGDWNRRRQYTRESKAYYANHTDIQHQNLKQSKGDSLENPLRQADNRLSHRWHGLLTDQKASYVATYPPLIDLDSDDFNKKLSAALGDKWGKLFRHLVVNATNAGRAWIHVWEREGKRQYALVEDEEILPVYGTGLERELVGVFRHYQQRDKERRLWKVVEFWDDQECTTWQYWGAVKSNWEACNCFVVTDLSTGESTFCNTYKHGLGMVPFVPFSNNILEMGDLCLMYKDLVDLYDRVVSGYANDIEDIQEVIFVLDNYGGTDAKNFLSELRKYKIAKLDRENDEKASNLTTLAVDIPVEARNSLLVSLRKDILAFGQGVDPDPEQLGDVSGVGIKHKYGLLELKAGALETEFRPSVAQLVRMLLPQIAEGTPIKQTWTRNLIQNDLEQAQIIGLLSGITSQKTLNENNPLVDDAPLEERRREEEEQKLLVAVPAAEPHQFPEKEA